MTMEKKILIWLFALISLCSLPSQGQELLAKVTINHNQIQGTDASVFENLQQTLEQFINDRQWTNLHFQKNERINCNFNITPTDRSSTLRTPPPYIIIGMQTSISSLRSSTS